MKKILSAFLFICIFSFLLASNVSGTLIDFDSMSPGDAVTTIDGVTFSSNTGLGLIASNVFDASSGDNYLGVDDGGLEVFLPSFGDIVTLAFSNPITSLSVNFISTPSTPAGAFSITTTEGSGMSGTVPDSVLGDGGEVFSVVFNSINPFTTADLTSINGIHSYNIDDISSSPAPIPEPASILLLGTGLVSLCTFIRKKKT